MYNHRDIMLSSHTLCTVKSTCQKYFGVQRKTQERHNKLWSCSIKLCYGYRNIPLVQNNQFSGLHPFSCILNRIHFGNQVDEAQKSNDFYCSTLSVYSLKIWFLYSGGQQRRVSLAAAMVHSPELLILDEPTVGVDPVLRQK